MEIHRFTPAGHIDKTVNITPAAADRLYNQVSWQARTPFAPYYRIVLTDPLAGGRIVRDTDQELFGKSYAREHYRKNPPSNLKPASYALGFGTGGE